MTTDRQGPGSASIEELRIYWRMRENGRMMIRRRSGVVEIFPNDVAIIRLVSAFATGLEPWRPRGALIETSDEWAVARRYMGLESLARITDTHNVRLPAVAT